MGGTNQAKGREGDVNPATVRRVTSDPAGGGWHDWGYDIAALRAVKVDIL